MPMIFESEYCNDVTKYTKYYLSYNSGDTDVTIDALGSLGHQSEIFSSDVVCKNISLQDKRSCDFIVSLPLIFNNDFVIECDQIIRDGELVTTVSLVTKRFRDVFQRIDTYLLGRLGSDFYDPICNKSQHIMLRMAIYKTYNMAIGIKIIDIETGHDVAYVNMYEIIAYFKRVSEIQIYVHLNHLLINGKVYVNPTKAYVKFADSDSKN